jgi:hypothetical protein
LNVGKREGGERIRVVLTFKFEVRTREELNVCEKVKKKEDLGGCSIAAQLFQDFLWSNYKNVFCLEVIIGRVRFGFGSDQFDLLKKIRSVRVGSYHFTCVFLDL